MSYFQKFRLDSNRFLKTSAFASHEKMSMSKPKFFRLLWLKLNLDFTFAM